MDQEPDLTKERPDEIQHQIDETRSALTDKLETLEQQVRGTVEQVRGTVQGAKASVEDTIESVKDSVHETVESVKRTLDVKYQVCRHPWAMVGGSVFAGFLLGGLMPGRSRTNGWSASPSGRTGASSLSSPPPRSEKPSSSPSEGRSRQAVAAVSGLAGQLLEQFDDEIREVKELAIGTVFGLVRDLLKDNVPPQLAPQVEKIMDDVTTKAGGKPITGPIVDASTTSCDPRREEFNRSSGYVNPVV